MQTLKFVKKEMPGYVKGTVNSSVGMVSRVSSDWVRADYWGMIKSRVSAFRMNYPVHPGLYAIGGPTKGSDVFVTANYKLTFDILRQSLRGMDAWVLVLDTKSINVWCAAGKGTFGTDELVKQISEVKLDSVVNHRRIILPQLGAVGVSAAAVQQRTGFRVSFGPVQARDIPAYVRGGYKKTREMGTITFAMSDRLILTPMEINPAMKRYPWFAAGVLLLFGLEPTGLLFRQAWFGGLPFLVMGLIAVFAGAFVTPVLLPFVPFRSFAIKGWIMGLAMALLAMQVFGIVDRGSMLLIAAAYLLFPAFSSYIALQFTGSTTYTGMSGVNRELKIGIPVYLGTAVVSAVLLVLYKLQEWRVL
ncbi:MAG TPA: mercury methylation corrinoid protein HgcA [Nitrospirota bacterium]|nr:mercury methylation corrinoid protein HgcA [Nitrospirota bacterium]